MTNLDLITAIRKGGRKPDAVFVDLVRSVDARNDGLSLTGHVVCEIAQHEALADIDFRPLRGLRVHLQDIAGDLERHRRAAALIAAVEPACLVMPIHDDQGMTLHRRFAGNPATSDTYRV